MRSSTGAFISIGACLALLALLGWSYVPESGQAINIYYGSGVLNPLLAGILAIGVIITFAATSASYISTEVGVGVILGLSLFIFLTALIWAVTRRVDVFLAPGWVFPAQGWILVGLSVLIIFGACWYAKSLGLLFRF